MIQKHERATALRAKSQRGIPADRTAEERRRDAPELGAY
jgi:hypothetical protein